MHYVALALSSIANNGFEPLYRREYLSGPMKIIYGMGRVGLLAQKGDVVNSFFLK